MSFFQIDEHTTQNMLKVKSITDELIEGSLKPKH